MNSGGGIGLRRIGRREVLQAGLGMSACMLWKEGRYEQDPVQEERRRDTDELYTESVEAAQLRGLAYLQQRLDPQGGFLSPRWGKNVAISGLAGIALLSRGHRPGTGPLGVLLSRIGEYVLGCCQESGFIESPTQASQGPMYEHGFATLFLAELHGMMPHGKTGPALRRAVELILRVQNSEGGWRYRPAPADADLSVTVCQIMALRAARNAGVTVPAESIDRAMAYVERSQNPDGGYMYQLSGGESRFALTAAAVVAMYNAGISTGATLESALSYLQRNFSTMQNPNADSYFYYAHYYSVQAFCHAGGESWRSWYALLRDMILPKQQADGSWFDHNSSEYGTAMACIILNMPRSVLPIFQR